MSVSAEYLATVLRHEEGRLYWIAGRKVGQEAGCKRKDGRVVVRVQGRGGPLLTRYRVIWALVHGAMPADEIDHRDGDPSNDHPDNLREATSSQNKWNRRTDRNNRTGLKGVLYHDKLSKWSAQIRRGGKSTHLGLFDSPEAANEAYLLAATEIAGEFARA